ncbi:MAG: hypothetical protein R3D32_09040 [Nitratireductor sp.]
MEPVDLRQAWAREDYHFTPWLAQNIGELGEAIGVDMEVVEIEASLPTLDDAFSADIHARNKADGTGTLIENQLEGSDHTHLGQILTYLAGLEAKSVVWVAKSFRESHLAAIKWLNENTRPEFSFFAVRISVVKIANSPVAPLFTVLEKPNNWERTTQASSRSARNMGEIGKKRASFWTAFLTENQEF